MVLKTAQSDIFENMRCIVADSFLTVCIAAKLMLVLFRVRKHQFTIIYSGFILLFSMMWSWCWGSVNLKSMIKFWRVIPHFIQYVFNLGVRFNAWGEIYIDEDSNVYVKITYKALASLTITHQGTTLYSFLTLEKKVRHLFDIQ